MTSSSTTSDLTQATTPSQFTVDFATLNQIVSYLEGLGEALAQLYGNTNVQLYIPPLSLSSDTSSSSSTSTASAYQTLLPGRPDALVAAEVLQTYFGTAITSVAQLMSYIDEFVTYVKEDVEEAALDASQGEQQNTFDAAAIESLFSNVPGIGAASPSSSVSSLHGQQR